jgi:hypothetical protein
MQFLAQVLLEDVDALAKRKELLLLFQCQNDPGLCDEWDPDSGGNAALLVPSSELKLLSAPGLKRLTTLSKAQGVRATEYDDARKRDTADDFYVEALEKNGMSVVGKLGGRPVWLQGDETPQCSCGRKMTLVVQIEYYAGGGINFGDAGVGYAFACTRCKNKAKFLWQCS